MRTVLCCLLLLLCVVPTAHGQGVALFGGFSYLRATGTNYENAGIDGWNTAISATLGSWGVAADFSNHYGASTASFTPIGNRGYGLTYLFGPQYSFRFIPRVTPFVHVMFGGVQGAKVGVAPLGAGGACPSPGCSGYSVIPERDFALALGGGVDVKVHGHLWMRPVQVDYLRHNFSFEAMNSPRISAGVVLRFGR